jgi:hypothetical protein
MATNVTQSTFLSQYNDDFRDSDHYHRILFNSGRALQARELTQLQTIIQAELSRLAGFVFKEGSIFNTSYGSIQAGNNSVDFVKVATLPTGYASLKGKTITNADGLSATIKEVIPAANGDPNTIFVRYLDSNNNVQSDTTKSFKFAPKDILTYSGGTLTVQTVNTAANPATGKGALIEVPSFSTFVAGHIVSVEKQSLVISKYTNRPTAIIGFKLTEQIITSSDQIALFDNAGSTPNLTSPGADRYQILLTLVDKANVGASETFYPVFDIKNGVARAIKNRDNVLNELGVILSNRTNSISGNFVERNSQYGTLDMHVEDDSDTNYLLYKLTGGVAFVGGNRNERTKSSVFRVAKPRNDPNDLDTFEPEFVSANYGNYFLADSIHGLLGNITNFTQVELFSADTRTGNIIGEARIRNIDEYDNKFRIHVFDIEMDSDGTGSLYSINQIRSLGTAETGYAELIRDKNNRFDIQAKEENSFLFPLRQRRAQSIDNVTMAVRRIYTATANGSGQATFSTGSSNTFTDQENWIASADSAYDAAVISPPTTSGAINTSVTITGLPANKNINLLAYENTSATRKTKTLNVGEEEAGVTFASGRFYLSNVDIYKFTSVVDDVTNEDITYKFVFDNGQRDNWYQVGSGKIKKGVGVPTGTVTVTYDYFSHSSGDFFAGKPSYPDIAYENVPVHTLRTGVRYRLTDVIDMRPVKDTINSNTFTSTGAYVENIPKNGGTITIGTSKYWNPRVDVLTMTPLGEVEIYRGPSSPTTTFPTDIPLKNYNLHEIILNPYTLDKKDTTVTKVSNLGYQMTDIDNLEKRISDLEIMTTLNAAEIATLKTTVPDPLDSSMPDRVKLGLTADGFRDNLQTAVFDLDNRSLVNRNKATMTAPNFVRNLPLKYDSDASWGTVQIGNTIWPKYTEEVMINQDLASKGINVNSFEITRSVGAGYLDPNIDTWTIRKQVDNKYVAEQTGSFINQGSTSVASQGDRNN